MVTIDFYNYTGRPNTINKTLTNPTQMQGVFRSMFNVLQPSLRVKKSDVFAFNYCYIHELNRYYFITNVSVMDSDNYDISLSLDVLKTYEDGIMSATATVVEQQDADRFLSSRQQLFDVRPQINRIDFEPNLFDAEGNLIMVTLKGN